jgi:hypothetical protein
MPNIFSWEVLAQSSNRSRSRNLHSLLAALFIPTLDGPNSRRSANEAVAVGKLRRITTLQNDYAASHPTKGFACQLPLLKLTAPTRNDYDPDAFLLSTDHAGYRIALAGCETTSRRSGHALSSQCRSGRIGEIGRPGVLH